jgi:hypothetical protein
MTRSRWRTPLGVALGFLVSQFVWRRTPSAVFPSGDVIGILSSMGLAVPDKVFSAIEWVYAAATPVGPAVALGALVCVLIVGADTLKRGVRFGVLIALLDVTLPLGVMIWHVTRGLSFPFMKWVEKAFLQPVAAITVGMLVGLVVGLIQRLASATRQRAKSSL